MMGAREWLGVVAVGVAVAGVAAAAAESSLEAVPPERPLTAADRGHWSFQPLVRPEVPEVRNSAWPVNPVDCFILARLEPEGLLPTPEADRLTLLRRVTFDLTGLPPPPAEIAAFIADDAPDAYERLVDRLLASPAYGERWAQHWLDLARFAETDGFEHDYVRPDSWQYRDWVIAALNADLPYDEFVRLQLAGDELRPNDPAARIATGFLLCGPDMPDINSQEERRHTFLNEMTATVGSVFLGLQLGCAQCHDHKYDPISQYDFYRLRAVFDPAIRMQKDQQVRALQAERDAPESYLMIRGDYRRRGPAVEPAFVPIANPWGDRVPAENTGVPRRTALANWLTRADHPLALRVIANRLWQHHFDRGIVATPSDFGSMGEPPTHPELLDWLALELPCRGWSLKQMHRLLVTSATYRQESKPPRTEDGSRQAAGAPLASNGRPEPPDGAVESWARARQRDPENRLLWRMNRRRLEGEAIRDAMLAASGVLSQRRGGAGVRPPLPPELTATLLKDQWPVSPDREDHVRRSIYLFVRRNLRYPLFEAFDKPDTNQSCPRRNRSTIAPQALVMLNAEDSRTAARALAATLTGECGSDLPAQIRSAYLRAFGRPPREAELASARKFLEEDSAALPDFCWALLNMSEFIYVD